MHGALVRMLQQAEPRFVLDFALDPRVLVFAVAAAAASALAVGLVPAVQMSRTDGATDLRDAGRGTIGSHREARSGRWLAALQLALSVPLLVGAGLLVRTAQNLEHPDLGFAPDRLLLARVNLGEIAADVARFNRALREIHARVEAIPGVEAATFSQLGLFSGGMSTVGIRVEGSALTAAQARLSALDRVGARYFTTLGIPIRRGRDISEGDTAGSPNVCVINEAFARQYFAGRDPLGLHVVTAADDGEGTAYQIVGVVADARTQVPLRNEADPRFFVAAEQRPSSSGTRTFLIRTRSSEPAVAEALRDLVAGVEPAASVSGITWFDGQLAELTAEDRAVARLAVVFGTVALTLAAIGLYGVLSYGVARRAGEIAIRIALGAQGRGVIAMILRESLGFVAVGLVVGTILAFAAARLLAGRLYGVSQLDPLTITTALAVLVTVAFTAAYLPARRASRVDPVAALHQA
jgi:predicted permease